MTKAVQWFSEAALIFALFPSLACAQALNLSGLGCFTQSTTQVSSLTIGPSTLQNVRTALGVTYNKPESCQHFIVEFSIPANAGANLANISPVRIFHFDAYVSEPLDSADKCANYVQPILIFKKPGNGNWSAAGYSKVTGSWLSNKCVFKIEPGQNDARNKPFQPPSSGIDHYRVASRIMTGNTASPKYRSVCIGVRFADIQNVPMRACDRDLR